MKHKLWKLAYRVVSKLHSFVARRYERAAMLRMYSAEEQKAVEDWIKNLP